MSNEYSALSPNGLTSHKLDVQAYVVLRQPERKKKEDCNTEKQENNKDNNDQKYYDQINELFVE